MRKFLFYKTILAAFALCNVIIICYAFNSEREPPEVDFYDSITYGMQDRYLIRILGEPELMIEGRGWPQTLGEIPGYTPRAVNPFQMQDAIAKNSEMRPITPNVKICWLVWKNPASLDDISVACQGEKSLNCQSALPIVWKMRGRFESTVNK